MSDIVIGFLMKNVFSIGLVVSALIAGAWLSKGRKTISNLLLVVIVVGAIMYGVMHPDWVVSVIASAHSRLTQTASGVSVQSAPIHLAQAHTVSAHHPVSVPTAKPVPTPKKVQAVAQITQQHASQVTPRAVVTQNPFTHLATLISQVCGVGFLVIIGVCVLVAVNAGRRGKARRRNAGQQQRCSKCNQVGVVQHYQASRGRTQLLCNDCAAHKRATLVA